MASGTPRGRVETVGCAEARAGRVLAPWWAPGRCGGWRGTEHRKGNAHLVVDGAVSAWCEWPSRVRRGAASTPKAACGRAAWGSQTSAL